MDAAQAECDNGDKRGLVGVAWVTESALIIEQRKRNNDNIYISKGDC